MDCNPLAAKKRTSESESFFISVRQGCTTVVRTVGSKDVDICSKTLAALNLTFGIGSCCADLTMARISFESTLALLFMWGIRAAMVCSPVIL